MGFRDHQWYRIMALAGTAFLYGTLFWMLFASIAVSVVYGWRHHQPPPEGFGALACALGMFLGGPFNVVLAAFLPAQIRSRVLTSQAYFVLAIVAIAAVAAVAQLFVR